MSISTEVDATVHCGHLNCPRCGLSIEVRPNRAAMRHCPRCVGRSRLIIELFSSTLPADVLYDENSLPRVGDELALANTPICEQRRQRARVGENFRQAQALALVVKRPMAISPAAVDERALLSLSAAATGHRPALASREAGRAPVPTFARCRTVKNFPSLTSHPEEPYHASQSF
jgi:hypothetical protein